MIANVNNLQKRLNAKYAKRKIHKEKTKLAYHALEKVEEKVLKSIQRERGRIGQGR